MSPLADVSFETLEGVEPTADEDVEPAAGDDAADSAA